MPLNDVAEIVLILLIFWPLPSKVLPNFKALKILVPKTVCVVSPDIFKTPPLARSSIVIIALPFAAKTTSLPAIVKVPSSLVAEVATPSKLPTKLSAIIWEPVPPITLFEPKLILPLKFKLERLPTLVILGWEAVLIVPVNVPADITEPAVPEIELPPKVVLPVRFKDCIVADLPRELIIDYQYIFLKSVFDSNF